MPIAIEVRGARYPLTIDFHIPAGAAATLIAGSSERELLLDGTITLEGEQSRLAVSYGAPHGSIAPAEYALDGNYPNPFNPSTTLEFRLPEAAAVKIEIFNTLGQKVAVAVDESLPAGTHRRVWDASTGADMPGGVYHARMTATGPDGRTVFRGTSKLLLIR